jgi:hypothetical protein
MSAQALPVPPSGPSITVRRAKLEDAPGELKLPQRLLRSILSRIRAELGDDDALSGRLQGQRG